MDRRLAVVTGGGSGIGRAVAAALARRGDEVVILGRRAEVLERTAAELGVRWRQADVTRRQDVQAAVDWMAAEVGPAVDVLVNNAGAGGGVPDGAPLVEAERVWDEVVAVNLKSAFLMAWAVLPHLRRPGGRVVNVSSIAAYNGRGGVYTVAKAGVVGLTYWLALDLGPERSPPRSPIWPPRTPPTSTARSTTSTGAGCSAAEVRPGPDQWATSIARREGSRSSSTRKPTRPRRPTPKVRWPSKSSTHRTCRRVG
jgi:3-oxoacyl-[acyl-carrier protein] reductase